MARVAEQGAGLHKTSLVELGIALLQFLVTHLINAGADKDVPRFVKEPEARKKYVEAFRRSSIEGMLNYYKANYPKESDKDDREFPPVKCPVLIIHGLQDPYLLPGALNDTWKWVENDLTLLTIPKAGHFVHRDAPERVCSSNEFPPRNYSGADVPLRVSGSDQALTHAVASALSSQFLT